MTILDAQKVDTFKKARSFAWSNILFRAFWNFCWAVLASWTPPQLHGWRRTILRLFGARIGKGVRVYGSARIWYPPNLEMADYSTLGPHANCYCMAKITIGQRATVSQQADLCSGTHRIDDEQFQLYAKPITVERYAWVAARAFVGPGVTVAEGAVLGACGVAFKDLAAWTVYAGNPAAKIRDRSRYLE